MLLKTRTFGREHLQAGPKVVGIATTAMRAFSNDVILQGNSADQTLQSSTFFTLLKMLWLLGKQCTDQREANPLQHELSTGGYKPKYKMSGNRRKTAKLSWR